MYWSVQILTWFVLPFFQEYENAGNFTVKGRCLRSLCINGIFYGVLGLLGLVFIIYLVIKNSMGFD